MSQTENMAECLSLTIKLSVNIATEIQINIFLQQPTQHKDGKPNPIQPCLLKSTKGGHH